MDVMDGGHQLAGGARPCRDCALCSGIASVRGWLVLSGMAVYPVFLTSRAHKNREVNTHQTHLRTSNGNSRTWRSAIADLKRSPPGAPSGVLGEGNPGWV